MKFGKYLAKRQLDLPEYANYFINYKALKKLIKALSNSQLALPVGTPGFEIQRALQENKSTFFFRLERELEKVNTFYEQKESELKTRLDILTDKKLAAYKAGSLSCKTSVTYISLHEGFQRFRRDLERLEQFIDLNATGFSKVLKKWDKRSKSHTKELYLSRQVEIQPVFHREELARFSDVARASLLELEALSDGDTSVIVEPEAPSGTTAVSTPGSIIASPAVTTTGSADDLYRQFVASATAHESRESAESTIDEWIAQLSKTSDARDRMSRIFLSAIASDAADWALLKLYDSGLVDIHIADEISGKNCLHRAASAPDRQEIIDIALKNNVDIAKLDVYGRTPLHYACLNNRRALISQLVNHGANVDALDKDNFSPLLYAIVNGFCDCINELLSLGAKLSVDSDKDYIPLNMACQYGNPEVVKIILSHPPLVNKADAEGLYPIHIVARAGHHELVPLLVEHGINVNEVDKLNQWTALGYAASEGHWRAVKALLDADADPSILDENGYTALYHAAWEGRSKCMWELSKRNNWEPDGSKCINLYTGEASQAGSSIVDSLDDMDLSDMSPRAEGQQLDIDIPDLSLPPPIIPLQRYGHNFLENKKIIVQLLLQDNPVRFLHEEDSLPAGGRLTISPRSRSSSATGFIPRTIPLPVPDSHRTVTFQVDSLDDLEIDFEIYSTFGTRIIAKGCALSYVFNQPPGPGSQLQCQVPLLDTRLRPVGDFSCRFQLVKPYEGKPLEITKYDTYWKSTSQVEQSINNEVRHQVMSFVTSSSVSGEYVRLMVCLTRDLVPIVCTSTVSCCSSSCSSSTQMGVKLQGINMPLSNLSLSEIESLQKDEWQYDKLKEITDAESFYSIARSRVLALERVLAHIPLNVQVNVQVFYPTRVEASLNCFGVSSYAEVNVYVDKILHALFDHARLSRASSAGKTRSLVFSSANPGVCALLNWKQPNYPVFFCMNAFDTSGKYHTAHGASLDGDSGIREDRRCVSLKDATAFASANNMLGVICDGSLLDLVPSLVSTIRVLGLVVVADQCAPKVPADGIEGVRTPQCLTFRKSIDM